MSLYILLRMVQNLTHPIKRNWFNASNHFWYILYRCTSRLIVYFLASYLVWQFCQLSDWYSLIYHFSSFSSWVASTDRSAVTSIDFWLLVWFSICECWVLKGDYDLVLLFQFLWTNFVCLLTGMDDNDNGTSPLNEMLDDKLRVFYFKTYLEAVAQAIK